MAAIGRTGRRTAERSIGANAAATLSIFAADAVTLVHRITDTPPVKMMEAIRHGSTVDATGDRGAHPAAR
jgi:hypothetical protein